jgi:putative FmdB family regulatory protein
MPIYEYVCDDCARRTEAIQRVGERPLKICPHCGGKLKKAFSAPAIQFKGSGWYVTDYARAKKEEKKEASSGTEAKEATAEKGEKSEKGEKGASAEKTDSEKESSKPRHPSAKSSGRS